MSYGAQNIPKMCNLIYYYSHSAMLIVFFSFFFQLQSMLEISVCTEVNVCSPFCDGSGLKLLLDPYHIISERVG